jgi:hypothetical protein
MNAGTTLRLAVVGHTNAGKTSLLRTLMRADDFGCVSRRPATTRQAEAAILALGDGHALELVDTPGFEDSATLLDAVLAQRRAPRDSGRELLRRFLATPEAGAALAQEAKALRQLLECELALLVVDAREPLLGKYLDEFRLVGLLGLPCLIVLNFTASPTAAPARWRDAARESGLPHVTSFDTVVFDAAGEQRLWQQIGLLLPDGTQVARVSALRARELAGQRVAAATAIAEFLIDVAAWTVRGSDPSALAATVRGAEAALHARLLAISRFDVAAYRASALPVPVARWDWDPFAPEILRELGLGIGMSAAKGAAVGATVDAVVAFHSLGLATLIGAGLGVTYETLVRLGRGLHASLVGAPLIRVEIEVAVLLARRAVLLERDLERRGHAAQDAIAARSAAAAPLPEEAMLRDLLERARRHPGWSRLGPVAAFDDAGRRATVDDLARLLGRALAAA